MKQTGPTSGSTDDSRDRMRAVNRRQKEYYDARVRSRQAPNEKRLIPNANRATNLWAQLRRRMIICGKEIGLDEYLYSMHERWMSDLEGRSVLDLGCYDGNQLSLWIAERCGQYTGIDLSEQAVDILNGKLAERNLTNARALAIDLLDGALPENSIDVVYAQGVIHHFNDLEVALGELCRIMKPDAVLITVDPMMTEPINRICRAIYRPFQSNAAWEWPFTRKTFRLLDRYFEIDEMHGYFGMSKLGFPLMAVPLLDRAGKAVSRWGAEFDHAHAAHFGIPFYLCWKVTMKLRARAGTAA